MMSNDHENRLTNLEILLTQQDDVVETLSRIVHQQRLVLEQMQVKLSRLETKLTNTSGGDMASEQEETPPPHY
ncbi:SlyX family protein [Leucothrix mucor]|jgi:SlyX protein|uniref:SlyX family protein n=1 Tax=Leucothrix mucor TaxID=45248 RepID=UPI0003B4E38F|nr:SlyX family protein [Leucothrix mucor]